jgi:hypothetical protein
LKKKNLTLTWFLHPFSFDVHLNRNREKTNSTIIPYTRASSPCGYCLLPCQGWALYKFQKYNWNQLRGLFVISIGTNFFLGYCDFNCEMWTRSSNIHTRYVKHIGRWYMDGLFKSGLLWSLVKSGWMGNIKEYVYVCVFVCLFVCLVFFLLKRSKLVESCSFQLLVGKLKDFLPF